MSRWRGSASLSVFLLLIVCLPDEGAEAKGGGRGGGGRGGGRSRGGGGFFVVGGGGGGGDGSENVILYILCIIAFAGIIYWLSSLCEDSCKEEATTPCYLCLVRVEVRIQCNQSSIVQDENVGLRLDEWKAQKGMRQKECHLFGQLAHAVGCEVSQVYENDAIVAQQRSRVHLRLQHLPQSWLHQQRRQQSTQLLLM